MKENMSFIGIDVSKLWFDASLLSVIHYEKQPVQTQRFDNTPTGIRVFEKWLKLQHVAFNESSLVVIENTGIYHRLLWLFCTQKQLPLHIGNAAHIKWSFGIARGKNDKIDSIRLCNYACKEVDTIKATPVLNPVLLQLKDLMTARTRLLNQVNANKTHIKELSRISDKSTQKTLEKAYREAIQGILKSIKAMEAEMSRIIAAEESIRVNYDLLCSIPGIGNLTALMLICSTSNFAGKISGKQLASYAGVAPFEYSSGSSIKGKNKVHKMGNKDLKKMLHLCAISVIRCNHEFRGYYDRKKEEGKHSMSILNAIRNKLVLRVVAVINNQRPYMERTTEAA